MGLSHSGYSFEGSGNHGDILPQGSFEPQLVVESFFGVQGEAHLVGACAGRMLSCNYDLIGYDSSTLLGAALVRIDAKALQLTGTLAITGNIAGSYPKCTFLGYERAAMFPDGSGVNGWCVFGRLLWRQRDQS